MGEKLSEQIERLEFSTVKIGDVIHIVTGTGEDAWRYDFVVENDSTIWPYGRLSAITPNGDKLPPTPFKLGGCGRRTNRWQNPVQTQERAFTPYHQGIIIGSFLFGKPLESAKGMVVFDKPGQEISEITVTKG